EDPGSTPGTSTLLLSVGAARREGSAGERRLGHDGHGHDHLDRADVTSAALRARDATLVGCDAGSTVGLAARDRDRVDEHTPGLGQLGRPGPTVVTGGAESERLADEIVGGRREAAC